MTVTVNPIADVVAREAQTTSVNLLNRFDDPRTTGLVARFELYNTTLGNNGVTQVVLFDQAGAGAPLTVQNFADYVNSGAYTNTIIHRSARTTTGGPFVVQGGGFTVNNTVATIPQNPAVQNEFGSNRSNLRGTIAMARLGGSPNSATNQWFFNLTDNSFLDTVDGGFTVFGEVLSNADLTTVDAIAALPRFNASGIQPAFNEIPLILPDPSNPTITGNENFVRYRNISISQRNELQFSILNNTNPRLVNATIQNNQLVLNYRPSPTKTAELTIRATNLLGQSVEDTFTITVQINPATPGNDIRSGTNAANRQNGLAGNDRIFGFGGNDALIGQQGRDRLTGGGGSDTLDGGPGNDTLLGNGGRDRLLGGLGSDILTGGGAADQFVFDINRAFQRSAMGVDVIRDFRRPDKIVLDRTTFTALPRSISFQSVNTVAQARNSAALITYVRPTGALYYNANGQASGFGRGGQFATLQSNPGLTPSDFVIQA